MPPKYWVYAFRTTMYVLNKLPSKSLQGHIPYELLYHKRSDFSFLRSFGSLCFLCLRNYNKHKLQPRSMECTFLSYFPQHQGYLCLDKTTCRLYTSCHVVFDEISFFLTHLPLHSLIKKLQCFQPVPALPVLPFGQMVLLNHLLSPHF